MSRCTPGALLSAGLALLLLAASAPAADDIKLFNGKDFSGWKFFVSMKGADPKETWSVKDETIICKGKPNGYIVTEKEYGDYELRLKWRWADKPGNSGVLLHVSGEDKIWPKSAEAQLFANNAGDIWLIGGYKLDVAQDRQDPKQARHFFRLKKGEPIEKKAGEWNEYVITCKGDTIRLEINGTLVNEAKGSELSKGKIALQAEGAEIHFKDITLKPIK